MRDDLLYLDHNAQTPASEAARRAVQGLVADAGLGNPSSLHLRGQRARAALDRARSAVAAACGVSAERVVFTSGATEADALGVVGVARRLATAGTIATLAIDHPALTSAAASLAASGWQALALPFDGGGRLDVPAAVAALAAVQAPRLIAIAGVHHELGTLQPIAELRAALDALPGGGHLHVDAAQAAGRCDLHALAAWADTLALSAQKCGGFAGAGALIVGRGVTLEALQAGSQERGLRGGTENLLGIVAFGAAAADLEARRAVHAALRQVRDDAAARLLARCPSAIRRGPTTPAHETGHVLSLTVPYADADAWVAALDVEGVAISAGAACSSGTATPSPAIAALHGAAAARRTLRISFGPGDDGAAVRRLAEAFDRVCDQLARAEGFASAPGSTRLPPPPARIGPARAGERAP